MGVGAALVMPTTLSIITNVFPAEERGHAVGIWAAIAGAGAIIGLLLSGALLEWFSWPAVFAVNVVLAALALVAAMPLVPTRTARRGASTRSERCCRRPGLVFAIIEAPQNGWLDPVTLAARSRCAARRRSSSSSCVGASRCSTRGCSLRRGFGVGSLSLTLQFFAQFGFLFIVLQYLQFVLGYSPLQAGLSMLPMALMLMVISPRAPRLAHRLGVRVVGGIGLALMGPDSWSSRPSATDSSYWHFGTGALITGIGIALATSPATTAIVSSLPAERQGIASAVNDLTREVGGAFGIAVLGSVLNSVYRDEWLGHSARSPRPLRTPRRTRSPPRSAIAHRAGPRGTSWSSGPRMPS